MADFICISLFVVAMEALLKGSREHCRTQWLKSKFL